MNASNGPRASRDDESRDAQSREASWVPSSSLPDPSPRPGLAHRWVRTGAMGQLDPVNVANSIREGWSPVVGADYPELKILSDPQSRYPESIEVGSLLLCSAPVAHIKARTEYYRRMAEAQVKSVNDQLEAEEDPRFRTMFRQHQTVVSRGFGPNARGERSAGPANNF